MLKAPFPYFGGKSTIAHEVWKRFGDVRNLVEPFFGSGAMLLNRPQPFEGVETVNDFDGLVANFWRAVRAAPDEVAFHADWPVNENDLHARHIWLVGVKDTLAARLEGDPDWYDAKIAGWWCWGMCCWIGSGFCSGNGPWQSVEMEDGTRQLVHVGNAGQGVNRQLVHVSNAGRGVNRQLVHVSGAGQGVNRKRVHVSNAGRDQEGEATHGIAEGIYKWMRELSARMKRVRVCSGDWSRVCTPAVTASHGVTAVFLDPPYADTAGRDPNLYRCDSESVAHLVREWAIKNGENPDMRIALCGYEGEHVMPESWSVLEWKAQGGMSNIGNNLSKENAKRERIWFSPHCVKVATERQPELF